MKQSKIEEMKQIKMSPYVHKDRLWRHETFERIEMHISEAPKI